MPRGQTLALTVVFLVVPTLICACPGDRDASGGPYVDVDPGEEIDLGDIPRGTDAEQVVTIQNVGPRLWEMDINEESIANHIDFYCLDGEDEECLTVDQFEERQWLLVVNTFCGDNGSTNIRLFFRDPESAGTNVEVMEEITLAITWNTVDDDGASCS